MTRVLSLLLICTVILSCVKEEPIPTYVRVNRFELKTDLATEGSNSQAIADVWVYLDDALQGVYELPVTFPVIASGDHVLRLRPGIKVSGLDSWRQIYPFYDFETQTVSFNPNQDLEFSPEVEYFDATKFAWLEAFENPGLSFKELEQSDTTFQRVNDPAVVFEGTGSGAFFLDTLRRRFIGNTTGIYNLPGGGRAVYLEMDYRCNNSFVVGVVGWNSDGTSSSLVSLGLFPEEEWNKTYVNLTWEVGQLSSAVGYSIYIQSILDNGNDEAFVYLDNFKLIHE